MTQYDDYLGQIQANHRTKIEISDQFNKSAKEWIPKLCDALKKENKELSKDDIRDRVEKDCSQYWQKDTIRKFLPEDYKDHKKIEAGKKGAEATKKTIVLLNEGAGFVENIPAGSDDKSADIVNPPSFSTAADLIPKVGRSKDVYETIEESINEDQQEIINQLKSELERVGTINERYSKELIELQEAVKKSSFKPAGEIKSFTFNDLPKPDDMNTFSYQNIELPTFRMGLGQLMLTKTKWNIWMERIRK